MDLSRMDEYLTVEGSDLAFFAEVYNPTVKEFTSKGLPSQQTTINFFVHYVIGEKIRLTDRLIWRNKTYEVVEILPDHKGRDYTVLKVKSAEVRGNKPFGVL